MIVSDFPVALVVFYTKHFDRVEVLTARRVVELDTIYPFFTYICQQDLENSRRISYFDVDI
jgi:hypothetical protein